MRAKSVRREDEGLRLLALEHLGALSPELARLALESGVMEVEPDVLAWNGSLGVVHGHLVILWLDSDLLERIQQAPSVADALTAAVASAVSHVAGNSLAELKILGRDSPPRSTAYRGRM